MLITGGFFAELLGGPVFFAKNARGFGDVGNFGEGRFLIVDAAVCEAAEAAVGIQKDLFRLPEFQGFLGPGDKRGDRLGFGGAWVDHAEADFLVAQCGAYDGEFTGSRSGELEDELVDVEGPERLDERGVVSFDEDVFPSAPVAAADVEAGADSLHAVHDAVQKLGGVNQFSARITAGSKGRSHECSSLRLPGMDDLGEDGFIELDEGGSGIAELDEFLAEEGHDILGHLGLVIVSLVGQAGDPHGTGEEIRSG